MTTNNTYTDIKVTLKDTVATILIQRPPYNYFDVTLIQSIAEALSDLDDNTECRAIVLGAEGKAFCAGANFGAQAPSKDASVSANLAGDSLSDNDKSGDKESGDSAFRRSSGHLYHQAVRLFSNRKPIVCAVHGAAIGGGLGLALIGDFRVSCPEARFSANFSRLGFHPGFGLTHTLPALIGPQKAHLMFYTGRRIKGEEALSWGLADLLVPQAEVLSAAQELAAEIAGSAPLAVQAIRATVRQGLADRVQAATDHELNEQEWLLKTDDAKEGIKATAERRTPVFKAR